MTTDGIAIVGIAGRFPGAPTIERFWRNLCDGVESITTFTDAELAGSGIDAETLQNPAYVKSRATLSDVEYFDSEFFSITPREAELMDPQHRIFLETAWHALEDAGYDPAKYSGAIGAYAGLSLNTYLLENVCSDPRVARHLTRNYQTGELPTLLGNDKDFLTTRVAYKLNLRGPAMTVQCACSTSLVAVIQACQSLLTFQCDMALAGAISISFPQRRGYFFEPGGIVSNDGRCRPFDEKANGTVFGDGVGVVVLKRFEDAKADRDSIYAVIKGFALNNDGASKVGYFAPSVSGQAEVIATAQGMAAIPAETIGYVEGHGTATPIGDPIELAALTQAFRASTDKRNFCALGSVKSNIGHLDAASGVAGLIKTTLALKHGKIPPTLHFQTPNRALDIDKSPFFVASKLTEWPHTGERRRAGVSSFGVGGTNAHVVLEEAPDAAPTVAPTRLVHLLALSARSRQSLEKATDRLVDHLKAHPELNLSDVAYTLLVGRRSFDHRRITFARDINDAIALLEKRDVARVLSRQAKAKPPLEITRKDSFGSLAQRWLDGEDVDWSSFYSRLKEFPNRVSLPGYPFQQKRHWIAPMLLPSGSNGSTNGIYLLPTASAQPEVANVSAVASAKEDTLPAARESLIPEVQESNGRAKLAEPSLLVPTVSTADSSEPRKERLIARLKNLFTKLSGQDLKDADPSSFFFDLGFDSLFLTQAGQALRKEFGIKVTFGQLLDELSSIEALAEYLDVQTPADAPAPPVAQPPAVIQPKVEPAPIQASSTNGAPSPLDQMAQQLAAIARQLETLRQANGTLERPSLQAPSPNVGTPVSGVASNAPPSVAVPDQEPKRHGPFRPIDKRAASTLSDLQQKHLTALTSRYAARTKKSKEQTQTDRQNFSDPRTAGSFNRAWKEMVYPIIVERSEGARMWDIDGNEYVDLTMGFGTNLLGHAPQFVRDAISNQLPLGMEVGPSTPLAGKVAKLICEFTGMERVAFCNTGSEAILAAIRMARTVTGRTRIATTGGFHGLCDEVLVRANVVDGVRQTVPVAPGIPEHIVRDVLVLDYGSPDSLEILKSQAHELAALLVEPVQGRHPDLQPREFLREARRITREAGAALVMDEVITGFRCHPGGAQALFDVRADIATYGKIIGGGMPIGAVAGTAQYMDSLDGGQWQYGDGSFPEVGVTFFAGTYIRHPLTMAASWAVLNYLKEQGPELQNRLNQRTKEFVQTLNQFLIERGVPLHFEQFSSFFYPHFNESIRWSSLLFFYLREKGIHIWEGRIWFLSTAHTDADLEKILNGFKESIIEMQEAGFLPGGGAGPSSVGSRFTTPATLRVADAVKLSPTDSQATNREAMKSIPTRPIQFSLYFFGNYSSEYRPEKYNLILEAAKFGDENGFHAIWLPERHFHSIGGYSPNPAVMAAALARETKRLRLHGGSVVLPLHHPVRVAEEWALVDNLSGGRVGISVASGWHPNDFVLAPNAFERRRELSLENLELIQKLWRGGEMTLPAGAGNDFTFRIFPQPKQPELPVWLTCIHKESYAKAGELGIGVLGYLMNQSVAELAEKIRLYHDAWLSHGHDPAKAHVTILLHTFVGADLETARETAKGPLKNYLRSFLDNSQKRLESTSGPVEVDAEDIEFMLDRAYQDYVKGKSLIGSPESCQKVVEYLREIGVNEIGCFVDFGVAQQTALQALPHLLELKQRVEAAEQTQSRTMEPADGLVAEHSEPMTQAQRGLWTLSMIDPVASKTYNESTTLAMRENYDHAKMERSLQALVDRHEALRTHLAEDGETQIILPSAKTTIPIVDLSHLPLDQAETEARRLLKESESQLFDWAVAPMIRSLAVKISEQYHLLTFTFHHILGNGPSYWVFLDELCKLYGGEATLPPAMQLSDFARIRPTLSTVEDETFWLTEFANPPAALELPTDHARPPLVTFNGGRAIIKIDKGTRDQIQHVGASQRCSMFMMLFAAFNTLLHRISNQNDLAIGVAFASAVRDHDGGDFLFANSTNVVPLRSRIDPDLQFCDYLKVVKSGIVRASEHQEYFFGNIINALNLPRDPSRSPLFSILFNYETGEFRRTINGLEIDLPTIGYPYRGPTDTAMYELYLNIAEVADGLEFQCDYNADLFDKITVTRWLECLRSLLSSIVANPNQLLSKLEMMDATERDKILVHWNQTRREYPAASLKEMLESQFAQTPNQQAVILENYELTYKELHTRANMLAHRLKTFGVGPNTIVGVLAERSVELVLALIGIIKAGGAYLPLDPDCPSDRLQFVLKDAQPKLVLAQGKFAGRLPANTLVIALEDDFRGEAESNLKDQLQADSLAYVIYTSGSTGQPKGVMITHRAVTNFLRYVQETCRLAVNDRVIQKSPFTFDFSVQEFFWPLTTGATLVVARPGMQGDSRYLTKTIREKKITALTFVPSMLATFLDEEDTKECSSLKRIVCCGEALSSELQNRLFSILPNIDLINFYGPTEAAVAVTSWKCSPASGRGTVPIGTPFSNTQIYLLDRTMQPVPVGLPGELHIGGTQVARGYLARPELTLERFVENPFGEGKLYKTGDLARYRDDGVLEFIGRTDFQIKLRGFRIELEEIEATLKSFSGVRDAVVIVRDDHGNQRLVAYVIADGIQARELRAYISTKLPDYMIPSAWIFLKEFPLTAHGKLDRGALPEPAARVVEQAFVPPRDQAEAEIAAIWANILHLPAVGVTEDFFELGGDSLLGVRLFTQIRKLLGTDLPLATLFQAPTVEQLATLVKQQGWRSNWSPLVPIQPNGNRTPVFAVHGGYGEVMLYRHLSGCLGSEQPFYGLQAQGLDGSPIGLDTVEGIATTYLAEVRKVQAHGPYLLAGYCSGGAIAFEMAQQLHRAGEEVALVALIDSPNPGRPPVRLSLSERTKRRLEIAAHLSPLDQLRYFAGRASGKVSANLQKWRGQRTLAALEQQNGASIPENARLLNVITVYDEVVSAYRPTPFAGRLTLFRAKDLDDGYAYQKDLGWTEYAKAGLQIIDVVSEHYEMLKPPHVQFVANKLEETIRSAFANHLVTNGAIAG
jgi:amino acid adenylation domain-containing protein/natural product biosynthesis luciferase-like monooxygenase protein